MLGQKSIEPTRLLYTLPGIQLEPTEPLLPGASRLPPSIGRKLTIKNAAIGAAIVVGGYIVYAILSPPKRKPIAVVAAKPVAAKPVAGFGWIFGKRQKRWRRKHRC